MEQRNAQTAVVVGAGMGGLAAAIDLARSGFEVTVVERAGQPGGKMRTVDVGDFTVDAGPTVLTMRWVFEGLLGDAGLSLDAELDLEHAEVLARHAWRSGGELDLHADIDASAAAIAAFAGAREADGFRRFMARAADMHATLVGPFMSSEKPGSSLELVRRLGLGGIPALLRTAPMSTLWRSLGRYFKDPRMRQLFGRYSTYVGSSPLLAPATLMLIAFVEQDGVWRVRGGMHAVARALVRAAERHGARFEFGQQVERLTLANGRVDGIELADGRRLPADVVVFNGDTAAVAGGLLGEAARPAAPPTTPAQRSLSAVTWCVSARIRGFDLSHHNVFFAEDYPAEFNAVFRRRTIVDAPTVYVCAQGRSTAAPTVIDGAEPLLILVNAPADGDVAPLSEAAMEAVRERAFALMASCGLEIEAGATVVTGPAQFEARFSGTGGALYGRANHGPFASFNRPGTVSRIPGLYFTGGSVHPGAGIPMATVSGRLAAARVVADRDATGRRSVVSVSNPWVPPPRPRGRTA